MLLAREPYSKLELDESVVLYPSPAIWRRKDQCWLVAVRGSVHASVDVPLRKRIMLRLLRRAMNAETHELESDVFRDRISGFIVSGEKGKRLAVNIGDETHLLRRKSRGDGHFSCNLRFTREQFARLAETGHLNDGRLSIQVVAPPGDYRRFAGCVHVLQPQGVSVISDIDDTIKHSDVASQRKLLQNTFLNDYRAIDGMAELFRTWAELNTDFHYVSSSPWQLYRSLEDLIQSHDFPAGTFHLRKFRLTTHMLRRLFMRRGATKRLVIHSLMKACPQRKFLLIGDSGEHDPEIYGAIARKFPDQVLGIYIREVRERPLDASRRAVAFARLPDDLGRVYQSASELAPLTSLIEQHAASGRS